MANFLLGINHMKKYILFATSSLAVSGRLVEASPVDVSSVDVCDGTCDPDANYDAILPIGPSPLTCAYLSEASYINAQKESGSWVLPITEDNHHVLGRLEQSHWHLADYVNRDESGYVGSVWVNEHDKQVVLAHRGSADITSYDGSRSWATDLRSIVRSKPSDFVNHAIEMLNNDAFLSYRVQGFHPSITGHSLGGFLAQTCVAHSHVRGGEFDATYFPRMSAVVFDSPGAADFIDEYIRSNLESEKDRLPTAFNIMNFCVSPTVVSAFGRHYGVLYQFITGKPREWKSVVMDHLLGDRIRPYLELAEEEGEHWTSSCSRVAQWPQIELPDGIVGTVRAAGEGVTKGVFWLANEAWKKAKHIVTGDTGISIAESALGSSGNAVGNYYLASSQGEDVDRYKRLIKQFMVQKHRLYSDDDTRLRMGSEHLDRSVHQFMQSMESAKKAIAGRESDLGWYAHLKETYGDALEVSAFSLQRSGTREELILDESKSRFKTVFDAVQSIQRSLMEHGSADFHEYLMQKLHNTASLSEENRVAIKQTQQDYLTYESAVAEAAGSVAQVLILDTEASRNHRLDVVTQAGDRSITLNSALAKAPKSTATVVKMDQSEPVGSAQERVAREFLSLPSGKPDEPVSTQGPNRGDAPGKSSY